MADGRLSDSPPRTVADIFADFTQRRKGILKGLTIDADIVCEKCIVDKTVALFGTAAGDWELKSPIQETALELKYPEVGVTLGKNTVGKKKWLIEVARQAQVWLLSVAFYYAEKSECNRHHRNELFCLINDKKPLYEVVRNYLINGQMVLVSSSSESSEASYNEGDDKCTMCEISFGEDDFPIKCDGCGWWFHPGCMLQSMSKKNFKSMKMYCCSCP